MKQSESIYIFKGQNPGKTVAIFAGIHGNEKAGVLAMEQVVKNFTLDAGTAYFVFANPLAIEKNVRFVERNLNRRFYTYNRGKTLEDKRARELMKLLNSCDALLDLHGYNSAEDEPFIITNHPDHPLVQRLDFPVVVTGFGALSKGATDGYMEKCGKVGLCLECGSNYFPEKYVPLAVKSIYSFLRYHGLLPATNEPVIKKHVFQLEKIVKKQTSEFSFDRPYRNFDALTPGQVFARDGQKQYKAGENMFILFPRPDQLIGHEAFFQITKRK